MAIDGEPRDGDYARYIENLTRTGGATPGQVADKRKVSRTAAPPPPSKPAPSSSGSGSLSGAPWGNSSAQPAPAAPGQDDAASMTLARQATQRKIGVVLTIGGILAGWAAVRILFQALRGPGFDLDEAMPAVFLAFFAFMLFKAAGSARNPRGKAPLPPLKRSSYRKDGGA